MAKKQQLITIQNRSLVKRHIFTAVAALCIALGYSTYATGSFSQKPIVDFNATVFQEVETYQSIAQNAEFHTDYRLGAAKILCELGSSYKAYAEKAYSSIAQDENIDDDYRLDAEQNLALLQKN